MNTEPITIEFVDGAFDDFEGTQEELDELINQIYALVESGEIFELLEEATDEDLLQLRNKQKNLH